MAADFPAPDLDLSYDHRDAPQIAIFAGGCFWCTEGVFERLPGVLDVTSGYAGGSRETADYKTVCTGRTGHAEAIRITYEPSRITFGRLLQVFFAVAHDPTQLNRQGGDVGPQYRSAIFYSDEQQRRVAEAYIRQLETAHVFKKPIVTTLEPLDPAEFYVAEDYHQGYAELNPTQPYIACTALPKIAKLADFLGSSQR